MTRHLLSPNAMAPEKQAQASPCQPLNPHALAPALAANVVSPPRVGQPSHGHEMRCTTVHVTGLFPDDNFLLHGSESCLASGVR